ncbi:hypothetical protein GCM10007862_24660 [Dyella lipolytica]|nr:hypothetical protein GCM10007862_24660 [Dyella lipolytica]
MGKAILQREWFRQLAVLAGYLSVYAALHPFSDAQWSLIAPVRLACLLFLPYRYWLSLAIGDSIAQGCVSLPHGKDFGWLWAYSSLVPDVLFAMPIVWWCRRQWGLFPAKRLVNFQVLWLCSLMASAVWALANFGEIALAKRDPTLPVGSSMLALLFIGKYITILAILPWVLMARMEYLSETPWKQRLGELARNIFAADTLALSLSALLFLLWVSHHSHEDARQLSLLAISLPAAWLTFKPGWRAATLGATPAILCVVSLLRDWPDPSVFQSETFIAVTVTFLLASGARITAQRHRDEKERFDAEQIIHLARQNIHLNETRLRKSAQALKLAGSTLHLTQHQLLARFHSLLPANEARRYYRQATTAQDQVNQLADSMHPSAWRERGLPAALHETIKGFLSDLGVAYGCEIKDRRLSSLPPVVHMAIYRLACESIAHINTQMTCSRVQLYLRDGVTNDVHWVVLRVEGIMEKAQINDAVYDTSERQLLASKLGSHGFGLDTLRNHARLFDGELHERITLKGIRHTYLLIGESNRSLQRSTISATTHPWVT